MTSEIERIVQRALMEDIGDGDRTTEALLPSDVTLSAVFVAKSAGILAGWEVARCVFRQLDPDSILKVMVKDGGEAEPGQPVARITGRGRSLLSGERTALNILQRMSGIATRTRQYVEAVKGTRAVILDTRKTPPGLRLLDKMAVRIGGGKNHRLGLFDMMLIKENHIAAAGGIGNAVALAQTSVNAGVPLEVEVKDLDELRTVLNLGVRRILLDNMDVRSVRDAVALAGTMVELEVSGGVTLENVRSYAETGVAFISVGQLTHSVQSLDVSFLVERS